MEKQLFVRRSTNKKTLRIFSFILMLILATLACESTTPVDPTALAPMDLSGEDFSFAFIGEYDLSGKNFKGANFSYAELQLTDFSDTNLQATDFSPAFLNGVNFTNADLRNANLEGASSYFEDMITTFKGANLQGVNLNHSCINADWTGAVLDRKWEIVFELISKDIFPGQDLREYDLTYVSFTCNLRELVNIHYPNLEGINLQGSDLQGTDFSFADLSGANFSYAKLHGTSFSQSDLTNADFIGADLKDVNLSSANLYGAILSEEQLQSVTLLCTRMPDGSVGNPQTYCDPPRLSFDKLRDAK